MTDTETNDLVPEGFDLKEALHNRSTTSDFDRKRCPRCESINITPTGTRGRAKFDSPQSYDCGACSHQFDEPLPPINRG